MRDFFGSRMQPRLLGLKMDSPTQTPALSKMVEVLEKEKVGGYRTNFFFKNGFLCTSELVPDARDSL